MRRLKRIIELERLANQTQLVCPFPYDNPERNREIFYNFCRQYGESFGVSITEEKFGYLAWKKRHITDIIQDLMELRFGQLPSHLFTLLGTPIDFFNVPVIGMNAQCKSQHDCIRISLPKYPALLDIIYFLKDISAKAHEYMHAYNRIVAKDLLKRGLISFEGFSCDVEPGYRVPTHNELKAYERKFLAKMIKSEEVDADTRIK